MYTEITCCVSMSVCVCAMEGRANFLLFLTYAVIDLADPYHDVNHPIAINVS